MFIHIGNDNVIRSRDIVAIVDIDIISSSSIMKEMVTREEEKKQLIKSTSEPKSVVITDHYIYYSSLSASTLEKRSDINAMIQKMDSHTDVQELG